MWIQLKQIVSEVYWKEAEAKFDQFFLEKAKARSIVAQHLTGSTEANKQQAAVAKGSNGAAKARGGGTKCTSTATRKIVGSTASKPSMTTTWNAGTTGNVTDRHPLQ